MNTPMEPQFMDPPPSKQRKADQSWTPVAEKLIAHSGEWALVAEGNYSVRNLSTRIRASRGPWQGHIWESVTRKIPGSRPEVIQVYARHVRPEAADDPPEPPGGAG